jgi:hypothetical protein
MLWTCTRLAQKPFNTPSQEWCCTPQWPTIRLLGYINACAAAALTTRSVSSNRLSFLAARRRSPPLELPQTPDHAYIFGLSGEARRPQIDLGLTSRLSGLALARSLPPARAPPRPARVTFARGSSGRLRLFVSKVRPSLVLHA